MSKNIGGIETFFHTYYENMNRKELYFDFATVCDTVAFGDDYKKDGSKIFNLPNFMKHPVKYYHTLRKIIHYNKYNIVYVNMLSAANILPIKAAKKEKVSKIIVHSHNSGTPSGFLRRLLDKVNRYALKDKSLVKLACGWKAGEWLFGKKSNFQVINNAIDAEKFKFNEKYRKEIRKEYSIKDDEILLGNVGRLCEQKNQMFLIDVLRNLEGNYKLMLVGDGDKEKELKEKISEYSLEKRVIFVKNTKEIEKYYSAFDLFVFPSVFEGLGIAAVEAQANGLKCLISKKAMNESNMGNVVYLPLIIRKWVNQIKIESMREQKPYLKEEYSIKQEAEKLANIFTNRNKDLLISIIVPLFNNEEYVSRCMDSLINQTYKNIEIVVINDGSTDDSEKIIGKYLEDKRIVYKKQKNSGANIARGNGVKSATGDYIMFVDSDDWIEKDAIAKLVGVLDDDVDIVRFNHFIEPAHKQYKPYRSIKGAVLFDEKMIKKSLISDYNFRELAFGMYNSKILKDKKIFERKMSFGEDYYVNLNTMPKAKKIVFCGYTLYHYLKNTGTSTTSTNNKDIKIKNFDDTLILSERIFELYKSIELNEKEKGNALANILDVIMWSLYGIASCFTEAEFRERISDLSKSDLILECNKHKRAILSMSRRKSFKYFVFHHKMISNMVMFDDKKLYYIAREYNRRVK